MRSENVESMVDICLADTPADLVKFVQQELSPKPYKEESYRKVFKKGGPLEWFNPPVSADSYIEVITEEKYVELKREEYRKYLSSLPRIVTEQQEESKTEESVAEAPKKRKGKNAETTVNN